MFETTNQLHFILLYNRGDPFYAYEILYDVITVVDHLSHDKSVLPSAVDRYSRRREPSWKHVRHVHMYRRSCCAKVKGIPKTTVNDGSRTMF